MSLRSALQRTKSLSLATLLLTSQLLFAVVSLPQTAFAANEITTADHEGQLKPTGTYSNGNITTYSELDSINFRFTLNSSATADGQMQVRFSGVESTGHACTFFQQAFSLGTHDASAAPVVAVSGATPVVTTVGTPTASGDEWVQVLNVDFSSAGSAVVNYYLTLTDEAGDCGGSSQHSRLANVTGQAGGDFANIGAQNVPVPAKDIIELASITVTKYVDDNGDGVTDRTATSGEWSFSLDGGTPITTNSSGQVVFANLNSGSYTISESGPGGYSFLGVTGTNCVAGQTSGTAVATVTAATTAVDASCNFSNGVAPGKIKIVKNAVPNNLTDFAFTATGTGVSDFTLDDDSGVAGADDTFAREKQFTGLTVGQYTFTEAAASGWDLTQISCTGGGTTVDLVNRKVTVDLTAGADVTCTFENRQQGRIIVTKQTLPDGDATEFPVTITGDNTIHSTATQNVTDGNSVTFNVSQGTYDVNETVPSGWSVDESACQDLTINGNTALVNGIPTVSCTITNTKLATLTIIKDALPNHSQDFEFSVLNLAGGNFFLDDDDDATLPSQKVFSDLTPGQTYSVTEESIGGWSLTSLTCDEQAVQGATASVTPAPGQNITCIFKNTKLISISGTKYEVDADATDGTGATGLSGWTISLFIDANDNGILDISEESSEITTVTDGNGDYIFSDLLYGTSIILQELLQAGWTQIFSPSPFTLDSAENVTDKDFGNFENATISGYKWNDKDANDSRSDDEEKLSGWTITLKDSENTTLDSKVTDNDGDYSFTNVAPGTYYVCETQQTGWIQTFPNDNMCHTVVIDVSGENETANFGNQGRGSIQVNKNVDTDGDGSIDETGATNWAWDIANGAQDTATGTSVGLAAGDYTINEDQKTDYHFTSVVCTRNGNEFDVTQAETLDVTVNAGDTIICTFTNTRDTGTIEVIKQLNPDDDGGLFDLQIKGNTKKADASHGDTTGDVRVITGDYSVSEIAGTDTDLADYESRLTCTKNDDIFINNIETTASDNFTVAVDDEVVCTFTNTKLANVSVTKFNDKNRDGIWQENEERLSGWDINLAATNDCGIINDVRTSVNINCDFYDETQTTADNGSTSFTRLQPGIDYMLSESLQDGWTWSNTYCDSEEQLELLGHDEHENENQYTIAPNAGDSIECYIGNYQEPLLLLNKENNRPQPTVTGDTVTYTLYITVPETSGTVYNVKVKDLPPEFFNVIEGTEFASVGTLESNYASPGEWDLGTMSPGQTVTLTYQALIEDEVTPGTYPDLAFAVGTRSENTESESVYSNVHQAADPFDGTEVTVITPLETFGSASIKLANTGSGLLALQFILPLMSIGAVIALDRRAKKGGRA